MLDIKKFRKQRRLTQVEFGKKLGYTHAYISNIENQKERITDKFLDKLRDVFNIDVEDMKSYNQLKVEDSHQKEYVSALKEKYEVLTEKFNALQEELRQCMREKEELYKMLLEIRK